MAHVTGALRDAVNRPESEPGSTGDEPGVGIRSVANLPLGRIRRSDIEQWVKAMAVADLAAGTIKTGFNNVRSVFRAAVGDRLIPHDPSEGVAIPRQRRREAAHAAADT